MEAVEGERSGTMSAESMLLATVVGRKRRSRKVEEERQQVRSIVFFLFCFLGWVEGKEEGRVWYGVSHLRHLECDRLCLGGEGDRVGVQRSAFPVRRDGKDGGVRVWGEMAWPLSAIDGGQISN
jgi:hypothetical protein